MNAIDRLINTYNIKKANNDELRFQLKFYNKRKINYIKIFSFFFLLANK